MDAAGDILRSGSPDHRAGERGADAGPRRGSVWRRGTVAGAALLAAIIALATAVWQWRSAHSIPYWDQWGWVAQYRDIVERGLTSDDLLSQANEHRLVFPRLIFMLDMVWAGGNNVVNLAASDLLQCVTLAVIVGMGRSALRTASGAVAVCFAAMLLFNAAQAENVFWGFQVQFVMVYTAAVAAVALAASAGGEPGGIAPGRLVASWCASTVATFSMANGIGVWPVTVLLVLLRRGMWPAVATAALGAVEAAVYQHGYHGVPNGNHTSLVEAARSLGACTSYLLAYLGAVLAPDDPDLARFGGCAALVVGAWWGWRCRRGLAEPGPWPRFVAGILLFVLFSGCITAVGRFRFGDIQALSSRYLTPGGVLWSVLTLAVAIEAGRRFRSGARTVVTVAFACAAAAVGIHDEILGAASMASMTAGMPLASDAYAVGVRDDVALGEVTSDQPLAWAVRPFLMARSLGPFGDAESRWLGRSVTSLFDGRGYAGCIGSIDGATSMGDGALAGLRVEGWAWGGRDGLPSRVLATDAGGSVVGLARPGEVRSDVRTAVPEVSSDLTGFRGYARTASTDTLRLFTVSHDGRSLCEIGR